ncbi:MAG: transporter substrate-binding domain-containing protein [Synergistaceae bacterium]|nr:transporter substrate-binding domain-containing protein [Synergistaceae bacterium]
MYKKVKFLLSAVVLLAFCPSAFGLTIGVLAKDVTEKTFSQEVAAGWRWSVLASEHSDDDTFKFYDNINSLLLALDAGDIDEADLPSVVAEYVIAVNPKYKVSCVMRQDQKMNFVFGFLNNDALRDDFNKAILEMKRDGTLQELQENIPTESAKFDSFPDAKTIRVAITGDIPPIDYIAADGEAAGFNTAVLSEIGRRLKINIQLVNVNTASRTTALASGRVDVVFWYMIQKHGEKFNISDNVSVSVPYYSFDTFLQIRK